MASPRSSHLARSSPEYEKKLSAERIEVLVPVGKAAARFQPNRRAAKDARPVGLNSPRGPTYPSIVLTSHQEQRAFVTWRRELVDALRNVSLLERPIKPITLTSAVQSAMRAKRRQYEFNH
jgi:hypothetical protein